MRACFLGQTVCALGYGVAMLQALPPEEKPHPDDGPPGEWPKGPLAGPPKVPIPNRMFEAFKRQPHFS
jgi:hypothetical protein